MKTSRIEVWVLSLLTAVLLWGSTATAKVIWHDPQLNWDFWNTTGQNANDFDIIVEDANFNPPVNDPSKVWSMPFQTVTVTHADYDGDTDIDTKVSYSNPAVPPAPAPGIIQFDTDGVWWPAGVDFDTAHGGLYMTGSGPVQDAYWTWNGAKIGASYPVTYERTRVDGDPELHMELNIAPGFFGDSQNAGKQAGWTEIRTFANIPASLLDLPDLNKDLDLTELAQYEVTPRLGGPDGEIITPSTVITNPDSRITDIYLTTLDEEHTSPLYEALLVAQAVTASSPPIPAGMFWNLNPQSPEPATLLLLAMGFVGLIRRR